MLICLLSACYFPSAATSPSAANQNKEFLTPNINIQLKIHLFGEIKKDETIGIEILDEVTGLPFNKQTLKLNHNNDLEYAVNLTIPTGSVIKYRYVKIGEEIIPEGILSGQPVRYRMLYASEPKVIHDVIKVWGDEPVSVETGILTGTVLNENSSDPVQDVFISAGGQLTITDANGHFTISGLPAGEHNVLFYAVDGQYKPFQQGAVIAEGSITPVSITLQPAKPVIVRFDITPPNDALGAPIYMAGNLIQLGNMFSDLVGGTSIKPGLMPELTPQTDGTLSINLQLYAGVDLRYKFTLGDGYWNAERGSSGEVLTRQLIVPDHDAVIDLTIKSWHTPGFDPITFEIEIPPETTPLDEKFIQFKQENWMEPIPLWPLANGKYLYILYSPFLDKTTLSYRFCRNAEQNYALNVIEDASQFQIESSETKQLRTHTIKNWDYYSVAPQQSATNQIPLPPDTNSFNKMIELSPDMDMSWPVYASTGLVELAESGVDTVVFTPSWSYQNNNAILEPSIGRTPFYQQVVNLLENAESLGLSRALYPQIMASHQMGTRWPEKDHSASWWFTWFESCRIMLLNYAKIAEDTNSEMLIIGGDSLLPAFNGGMYPDGSATDVPSDSITLWRELILDIRKNYKGKLIWAINTHLSVDPLPEFVEVFDAIYISVDSPLATGRSASFEEIAAGFTSLVDNHIYEVYRSTSKPIILALAYPSVDRAYEGCQLINKNCINDGLFLVDEMVNYSINLEDQALIYEAVLPIIASRTWVTGASIRGYQPTVVLQEGSSSIRGKPAGNLIFNWFLAINSTSR